MAQTLYIIGNGFDRMHNMPTCYKHFFYWLVENSRFDIILEMQRVFKEKSAGEYILWSDFETALGQYDIECAANWDIPSLYVVDEFAEEHQITVRESSLDVSLSLIVNKVFRQWVQSILVATERIVSFQKDALFLSFNYTDTLETLYGIVPENVLHIHGRVSKGEDLIVGHRNYMDSLSVIKEGVCFRENNERIQHICDMNELYKPEETLITRHQDFWLRLKDVDNVIVLGHSCNDVDSLYFEKVVSSVKSAANWLFYYHTSEDKKRVQQLAQRLGIKEFSKVLPSSDTNL